jgi:hypothetical protein
MLHWWISQSRKVRLFVALMIMGIGALYLFWGKFNAWAWGFSAVLLISNLLIREDEHIPPEEEDALPLGSIEIPTTLSEMKPMLRRLSAFFAKGLRNDKIEQICMLADKMNPADTKHFMVSVETIEKPVSLAIQLVRKENDAVTVSISTEITVRDFLLERMRKLGWAPDERDRKKD